MPNPFLNYANQMRRPMGPRTVAPSPGPGGLGTPTRVAPRPNVNPIAPRPPRLPVGGGPTDQPPPGGGGWTPQRPPFNPDAGGATSNPVKPPFNPDAGGAWVGWGPPTTVAPSN